MLRLGKARGGAALKALGVGSHGCVQRSLFLHRVSSSSPHLLGPRGHRCMKTPCVRTATPTLSTWPGSPNLKEVKPLGSCCNYLPSFFSMFLSTPFPLSAPHFPCLVGSPPSSVCPLSHGWSYRLLLVIHCPQRCICLAESPWSQPFPVRGVRRFNFINVTGCSLRDRVAVPSQAASFTPHSCSCTQACPISPLVWGSLERWADVSYEGFTRRCCLVAVWSVLVGWHLLLVSQHHHYPCLSLI